ncbi:hypothetical protein E2C01_072161 [Portunus trituberculatus]|uniref:Uncharacterized protein n=1 Tax=Portunus trituberculatus TaxID=210409 RepID=A0A5B7I728_PORTR|nr:hypothetical protein [Portunus trituberculatus]
MTYPASRLIIITSTTTMPPSWSLAPSSPGAGRTDRCARSGGAPGCLAGVGPCPIRWSPQRVEAAACAPPPCMVDRGEPVCPRGSFDGVAPMLRRLGGAGEPRQGSHGTRGCIDPMACYGWHAPWACQAGDGSGAVGVGDVSQPAVTMLKASFGVLLLQQRSTSISKAVKPAVSTHVFTWRIGLTCIRHRHAWGWCYSLQDTHQPGLVPHNIACGVRK